MKYSTGSKIPSLAADGSHNTWSPKAVASSLLASFFVLLSLVCLNPHRATAQVSARAKIQQLYILRQQNVSMYKYHNTICKGGSATYGPAYQSSCQILPVYRYYINQLNIILLQYGIPGVNPDA